MMETAQEYFELGLFVLLLVIALAGGWFLGGFSVRILFAIFARTLSSGAMLRSRAGGSLIGALIVFLCWGGFGGFGPGRGPGPGPEGKGQPTSEHSTVSTAAPANLMDPSPAASNPAKTLPPGIKVEGKQRQVRVALLGPETQPRAQPNNQFFLLIDEPGAQPLSTKELIDRLTTWRTDHQIDQVILFYVLDSVDRENPQVRNLQRAVESQKMQFSTKPWEGGPRFASGR
jgi:hypothetical protein